LPSPCAQFGFFLAKNLTYLTLFKYIVTDLSRQFFSYFYAIGYQCQLAEQNMEKGTE